MGWNLNFPKEFHLPKIRRNKASFGWLEKRSNKESKASSFSMRSIQRSYYWNSHHVKTWDCVSQIHEETKGKKKRSEKTQDGMEPLNQLWGMRATNKGCHFKCMFNNVPLLPFSTSSTYLKESFWSKKNKCLLFSAKTSTLLQSTFLTKGTACNILMRCSCFSGVKLSILFWASTRNRGIGMKLAHVVEQRWGDVAGMPVRLQGMHRILFYGSID